MSNDTLHPDPHQWVKTESFRTTEDVAIPTKLIDQVIGQEDAVAIALKAAEQKRHVLLIGEPGTGKSMLAKAMAEVLPDEKLNDVVVYHNAQNPNNPKVKVVDGGLGKRIIQKADRKASKKIRAYQAFEYGLGLITIGVGVYMWIWGGAGFIGFLFSVLIALFFLYQMGQKRPKKEFLVPKLLQEHSANAEKRPYVDATGAHAGALLGDVRHDPFQSGGLETPPHVRVEEGAIHRAHKGVLFIDEINVLRLQSQQALLTALQDREYSIVGQSQSSSGAMVRTAPLPCDFILVAAGNLDAVAPPDQNQSGGMHPALRSRIRGYGYEVFVNSVMPDTHANRTKLVQFVAQEVRRDGKIPHFEPEAVAEIISEAQRRSGAVGLLTLRLRELGGLVRTAGDYARGESSPLVTLRHVRAAKSASRSLEQQILEKTIQATVAQAGIRVTHDLAVGVANGMSLAGTGEVGEPAGVMVRVEAAVVPSHSRSSGAIVIGPGLERREGSTVKNVGAVLKILKGDAIANHDIHVDAAFAHQDAGGEGVGMAAAVAAVSALESVPVRQDVALIGEVAVSGRLRPVRATLQRIEAAAALGFTKALVPSEVLRSIRIDEPTRAKIEVVPCEDLGEALAHALDASDQVKLSLTTRLTEHTRS